MRRVVPIAVLILGLVACTSATSPTPSSMAAPTPSPAQGSASPGDTNAKAAITLNRAPADLGCDSIGWPDDVKPFHALTFRIDAAAAEPVTVVSDTGVELQTFWIPGFEAGSSTERVVRSPDGQVVARDGEVLTLPPMQNALLHGYHLCLTPTSLTVMLIPGG